MAGQTIKLRASEGGAFDGSPAAPATTGPVPALVLAGAVHGVDADIVALAVADSLREPQALRTAS